MKLCLQFCWNIENQESSANTSELEHIIEVYIIVLRKYSLFLKLLARIISSYYTAATVLGIYSVVDAKVCLPVGLSLTID